MHRQRILDSCDGESDPRMVTEVEIDIAKKKSHTETDRKKGQ